MPSRTKARELAMQLMFLWDTNAEKDDALTEQAVRDASVDDEERRLARQMATDAWAARETSDAWIARLAPHWPPRRQPGVDRSILRLGVWELTATTTPPKVVIDEAIELAKGFSTENSPAFVNAVLDAVLRETKALTDERR
jgi:N utilization substance protein B